MGYSQSKDSQDILEPSVINSIVGDKINNHMRSNVGVTVASSTIMNSFSNPSSSCYNASFSSQSNSLASKYKLISPKLDISVFENENPIQRRRRIMSGDRRTCYVMKLESLRQARLYNELNDSKQISNLSSTMASYGIIPENSGANGLCKNTKFSNLTTNSYKLNSSYISGPYEQYELQTYNDSIPVTTETGQLKELTGKFCSSDPYNGNGPYENTAISQVEELDNDLKNPSNNFDKWTDIVNKIKEKHKTQMRSVSLPNQLNRFSLSYNPKKVFNKDDKNDKEAIFSALDEGNENLITSEETDAITEVIINDTFCETDNYSQISRIEPDKTTKHNSKEKSIFDIISLPVGIFSNCFNAGIHTTNSDKCTVPSNKNIDASNFNAIITFESDYTDNGFDSDTKSSSTRLDKNVNDSKNLESTIERKTNTDTELSDRNSSKNSSNTFLSYRRVKTLFQKRIAEIENEEKRRVMNTSYYKELEELGRGHWQNGVWIPFGKVRPKK